MDTVMKLLGSGQCLNPLPSARRIGVSGDMRRAKASDTVRM